MVASIRLLQAKIHRATVTHADVNYVGSIAIPLDLLKAAGIVPLQEVEVWNVTNGERFATYAVGGRAGEVRVLGSAARRVSVGDLIIVASFVYAPLESPAVQEGAHQARLVFVDGKNAMTETKVVSSKHELWAL